MSLMSRFLAVAIGLQRAATHAIVVERNLEIPMDDGVILLADRWYPRNQTDKPPPVILMRTPYGRKQSDLIGTLGAERGYQVVAQSSRGTFGSGGTWQPFHNEQADGHATLAWLAHQPWASSGVATWGASYQGLSQWALAGNPGKTLRAMAIIQSDPDARSIVYPGGVLALETILAWMDILEYQESGTLRVLANALFGSRALRPAFNTLPLGDCDRVAFGWTIDFYQEWLARAPSDPWWEPIDFGCDLSRIPPTLMVGGWYDLHLPGQLATFSALQAAGRDARLVIGPWNHESLGITGTILREGFAWFDGSFKPEGGQNSAGLSRKPLRVYVMGSRKWVDLPSWPPPVEMQRWHFHTDTSLALTAPSAGAPRLYTYDPADPTPAIGGGATIVGSTAGSKDQRLRERRADVLTYTSARLKESLTVAGPLSARVYIRADVEQIDLFVRLCDVTPFGRSYNVFDGIVRLGPSDFATSSDGILAVRIPIWPTAYTFKARHHLRVQVSSAAHPMYARNTCTGEALASGSHTVIAHVEVFNDPSHLSGIEIPVAKL